MNEEKSIEQRVKEIVERVAALPILDHRTEAQPFNGATPATPGASSRFRNLGTLLEAQPTLRLVGLGMVGIHAASRRLGRECATVAATA